jgi:hypothetical protein
MAEELDTPEQDEPVETPGTEPSAEEVAAFAAGYGAPTDPPPEETPPVEPDQPAPVPEGEPVPPPAAQAPEWAKAQEDLRSAMLGKIGGLERSVRDLAAKTPAGQPLEFTAADFEEMQRDFPDLVKMTVDGFNRGLKRGGISGTSTDPALIEQRVTERLTAELPKLKEESALELMDTVRESWRDEVNSPAYKAWLLTQPAAYQEQINRTWKPAIVLKSLEQFDAAKPKAPAARPLSVVPSPTTPRRSRMASAVTPKTEQAPVAAGKTEQDYFREGYQTGTVRV